jgi:hypothetical protein
VPDIDGVGVSVPDTVRLTVGEFVTVGVNVGDCDEDGVGVYVFEPDAPLLGVLDGVDADEGVTLGETVGDGVGDARTTPAT